MEKITDCTNSDNLVLLVRK